MGFIERLQYKTGKGGAFAKKYKCDKLVYFDETDDITVAIDYEKKIIGPYACAPLFYYWQPHVVGPALKRMGLYGHDIKNTRLPIRAGYDNIPSISIVLRWVCAFQQAGCP